MYVQSFSGSGGRSVISSNGGREPVWSRDGKELFYRRGNQIWVVAVEAGPEFRAGTPELLFEGRFVSERPPSGSQSDDVSPMVVRGEQPFGDVI